MRAAARNLAIDRLTAEVADFFAREGIETLVLKGPVLADWLYPREVRPYGDSDLMVPREDWERAVALLLEIGFAANPSILRPRDAMREMSTRERPRAWEKLRVLADLRLESIAGTGFVRRTQTIDLHCVDLHCTLYGLGAEPDAVWPAFAAGGNVQSIGGAELRIPNRPALLLHVCLHAAHHHEGKALEDLRRAIATADRASWAKALELAILLDALRAFASGLRLVPEGEPLAEWLGVGEVRSAEYELRFQRIPTAEAVNTLLFSDVGLRTRAIIVATKILPRPEFMRWRSPLARRGVFGLIASYPLRWMWLAVNVPRAAVAVWRERRRGVS